MKLYNFLNESIPYSKSTQKDLDDRIWAADEKRKRKLKKDPPKQTTEGSNDSYYAYHDAAKKWSEDTGKPEKEFARAGVDVQDKYIEPEMKKYGLVPDEYMGKGVTSYKREGIEEDEVDGADYSQDGMIGTPDGYYDAEQRQEAYRDLKDALGTAENWQEDSIKDGICPECAGSGYMDGEYEDEDGNEGSECYGWGDFGCDEGEMTQNDDGLPNWAEIAKHDERKAEKANRGPAPSKEQIMKLLPILHKDYVQSGRYNAFELGGILRQMYPELGKREASSYVADFFSTFSESAIYEDNKGEGDVAKMLSKALGDENRWTEMSPYELFAELESQNPEVADMLAKVAKQLYDVKLKERTYKDVGVADVVKDKHRGKEFKFNKDTKTFQSGDGEEASVNTPLGKELMKSRKSQMRKSTPSAHKKKAPKRPSLMSQIFGK